MRNFSSKEFELNFCNNDNEFVPLSFWNEPFLKNYLNKNTHNVMGFDQNQKTNKDQFYPRRRASYDDNKRAKIKGTFQLRDLSLLEKIDQMTVEKTEIHEKLETTQNDLQNTQYELTSLKEKHQKLLTETNKGNFNKIKIDNCSICLFDLTTNLTSLRCGHTFHEKCLYDLLEIFRHCPVCRKEIDQYPIRLRLNIEIQEGKAMDLQILRGENIELKKKVEFFRQEIFYKEKFMKKQKKEFEQKFASEKMHYNLGFHNNKKYIQSLENTIFGEKFIKKSDMNDELLDDKSVD